MTFIQLPAYDDSTFKPGAEKKEIKQVIEVKQHQVYTHPLPENGIIRSNRVSI